METNTFETSMIKPLRDYYDTGITRDIDWRLERLKSLKQEIIRRERCIYDALRRDLGKSEAETYLTEIGIVINEIDYHVKHLKRWAKPRRVKTPLAFWPARSRVMHEPRGVVLVIAPWNYPFQLLFAPLVGALSSGNCVTLKPSPRAPATARVALDIVSAVFAPGHVAIFEGDGDRVTRLLRERFDYIFFTGGPRFGREVMAAAARHLTPVTLELGGKSPCVVGREANPEVTANRVAWGKFLNAGQTCVAPDYALVPRQGLDTFINALKKALRAFYGEHPAESPDYARLVDHEAVERLKRLIHSSGRVVLGGEIDAGENYIAPTVLVDVDPDSPVMTEEIFGPVLPVLTYDHIDDAIAFVNSREKPLALYYFGSNRVGRYVLQRTSSGGACINDTIIHLANPRLPFGGVGNSGMGKYHGKSSFELFSNLKSVVFSSRRLDNTYRYPPYKHMKLLKKMM